MTDLPVQFPTYETLGVRPLINCVGTVTVFSGSVILPEVRAAMMEASKRYVAIEELMAAACGRIAELMQCEWALVTNGCAAALAQVTAGIVAGLDHAAIQHLPDVSQLKNVVIAQKSHRHGYDQAISMTGVRIVDVTTRGELLAAMNVRVAMFAFLGQAADDGEMSLAEMASIGREYGIPTFVDAAAERPDAPNRYLAEGADVVAYSGGKCLRGPQASGLVLGRKDILEAAFANASPHHSLGRPMKVGKEEIMGLLAAVEQWVSRDHKAEWRAWERRLAVIAEAVERVESVRTEIMQPGRSNVAPTLRITWDRDIVGHSPQEVQSRLSAGDPRIEVPTYEDGVWIMPYMMEGGEEVVVAERLSTVLLAEVRDGTAM